MDPPPPPPPQPPPLSSTTAITATAATVPTTAYPDSIDSSPRSRTTESYLDDPPPPLSTKLRLMCSYGGHIVPRPHDKSLCYVGGDTRIVVVDRNTTLSSLSSRLSNTLLNGRSFTLKYQLPSEDLDSLISVTTDEDLDNMIDEYDRTSSNNNSNSGKSSRLRLFLFPIKPDSTQSIGPILESSGKSEDWFLNALNGATLNRGFSDSASVNCLLGLDDDDVAVGGFKNGNNNNNNSNNSNNNVDLVGGGGVRDVENLQKKGGQDVHSVPDSPMLETTSSFGSTSSSPSLANLPPIRVHVEDGGTRGALVDQKVVGIEEQFAQITVSGGSGQKQDEGFMVIASSPPPLPVSLAISGSPMVVMGGGGGGEYQSRVFSDDERSDHGVPVVSYRKMPPPPQTQTQPQTVVIPQTQQKSGSGGGVDLASPDSVSSDSSLNNAINRQKPAMIYQDQVMQMSSGVSRLPTNPIDPKINFSDPNHRVQIQQQVQDSGYVFQQPQYEQQQQQQQQQQPQQQFIHAGAHYIQHHPTGGVAYYPVYPPQQQHLHQQHHHQLEQQYPVYYMPARQPQAYNMPVQQSSISEPTPAAPSTHPQTPPNPTMVPPATYNQMRNAPMAKPEMAPAGMYRTTTTGTPQLVQVPSNQHQQQYLGYSQVHHPSQSVAPTSAGPANYAYEFADPSHAQIYYTQPLAPTMPSHYQTMLPENSAQLPTDSIKQQIRTSQPI
ncbi:ATP binding protein, putative [Ricinus communis]|uniref:ATP binding protein, putative n=1 Tax=Ricinus communis TaxID=3988 RepID=B9SJW8_RICCO|nr:ATP binding protein, putative [Ricinus communis]|eukprot:XP_002526287.1 serine/threonine-protein kinase phg2 [Ricinus communis]